MQAALKDLSSTPHDSPSFLMCQRLLHKCHEIIFGDLPSVMPAPYSSISLPSQSRLLRKRVKHNIEPALVGIGMVLAGVPAMPIMTHIMGDVAVEQGRLEDSGSNIKSLQDTEDDVALSPSRNMSLASLHGEDLEDDPSRELQSDFPRSETALAGPNSEDELHAGKSPAAQTAPALPLHLRGIRQSRLSEDPLGQLDSEQMKSPYQSTPAVSSARPPRPSLTQTADVLLQSYDAFSQSYLLRSQYCRSEVSHLLQTSD
jgi:phosphatidylinositol 4-kinase B